MPLTYHQAFAVVTAKTAVTTSKQRAIARCWVEGVTNMSETAKTIGVSRGVIMRVYRHLAAKSAETPGPIGAQSQPDAYDPVEAGHIAPQTKPEIRTPIPEPQPEDPNSVVTGPSALKMLDSMLVEAHNAREPKNFKDLLAVREKLVNMAAEMPTTAIDIERALGPEGTYGMDGVLAATLSKLPRYFGEFPKVWKSLCLIFNRDPDTFEPAVESPSAPAPTAEHALTPEPKVENHNTFTTTPTSFSEAPNDMLPEQFDELCESVEQAGELKRERDAD